MRTVTKAYQARSMERPEDPSEVYMCVGGREGKNDVRECKRFNNQKIEQTIKVDRLPQSKIKIISTMYVRTTLALKVLAVSTI